MNEYAMDWEAASGLSIGDLLAKLNNAIAVTQQYGCTPHIVLCAEELDFLRDACILAME